MRTRLLAVFVLCAALVVCQFRLRHGAGDNGYVAATYNASAQQLTIFPFDSDHEIGIRVPFGVGAMFFNANYDFLYAMGGGASLFKLEFNPARISTVPGFAKFSIYLKPSKSRQQEQILVDGNYLNEGQLTCGIFAVNLSNGGAIPLHQEECGDASGRSDFSPSPDAARAVEIYREALRVIDLSRGTSTVLGQGFHQAAWSPDGKWIAALERGEREETVLFDAATLTRVRTLERSTVSWSPDSRYLLASEWVFPCPPLNYSLQTIDIETGDRETIRSSKCKVLVSQVGWVKKTIAPQ